MTGVKRRICRFCRSNSYVVGTTISPGYCSEHCFVEQKKLIKPAKYIKPKNEKWLLHKARLLKEKKARKAKRRLEKKKLKKKQPAKQVILTVRQAEYRSKTYEFYKSNEWRRVRFRVLMTYGRKCMCCGNDSESVHVDHIKPLSKHWELRLDFNNLQVLCRDCNLGKSNVYEADFRPKSLELK